MVDLSAPPPGIRRGNVKRSIHFRIVPGCLNIRIKLFIESPVAVVAVDYAVDDDGWILTRTARLNANDRNVYVEFRTSAGFPFKDARRSWGRACDCDGEADAQRARLRGNA